MGLKTTKELEVLLADKSNQQNHENIKKILEDRKDNIHLNKMILDQLILQSRTIEQQDRRLKSINSIVIFYFVITVISLGFSIMVIALGGSLI